MLLARGFKGLRPGRDINIAAIVAKDYASQQCAPLQERIKELEAENDWYIAHEKELAEAFVELKTKTFKVIAELEAELQALKNQTK